MKDVEWNGVIVSVIGEITKKIEHFKQELTWKVIVFFVILYFVWSFIIYPEIKRKFKK